MKKLGRRLKVFFRLKWEEICEFITNVFYSLILIAIIFLPLVISMHFWGETLKGRLLCLIGYFLFWLIVYWFSCNWVRACEIVDREEQ